MSNLKQVTFKIGVDVIGQPLYHTHYISESKTIYLKPKLVVRSKTHR